MSVGFAAWNIHNDARRRGGYSEAVTQRDFYFNSSVEVLAALMPLKSIRVTKPANMSDEVWRVYGPERLRASLANNLYYGSFGLAASVK